MAERFCEPNIVKSRVARAFVSRLLPEPIINELKDMCVIPYKLGKTDNISSEIAYHPDILLNNFRKGMWLCENDPKYLPVEIKSSFFTESETELSDSYPFDCPFNNFRLNGKLVCGKSADYLIKAYAKYEDLPIIYVEQNYTKCCCVLVNENAVITSDYYIGRALRKNGFDVLTIEDSSEIGLKGMSHGLIGGCGFKIAKDLIAFTGDLNKFKYGDDIRAFCGNYKIDAYSITNERMYDYGGLLPITEYVPKEEIGISEVCNFDLHLV